MACTWETFILYKVTPRVKSFCTYVVYSHTEYIKLIAQNRTSDAADVLQFQYSKGQRFTREILLKFSRKAPLKKLRNLSLSLKRGTMTVLKLTEGLGLTGAGI